MKIEYLEVDDVELLHDLALQDYGGLPGREKGKLEANLAIPKSGFQGHEAYPSIYAKAAAYHFYLASGHCFFDGNKRTSYLAAFTFLSLNGFDLIVPDEEVEEWTIMIADHEKRPPFEEAVCWLKEYAIERTD